MKTMWNMKKTWQDVEVTRTKRSNKMENDVKDIKRQKKQCNNESMQMRALLSVYLPWINKG